MLTTRAKQFLDANFELWNVADQCVIVVSSTMTAVYMVNDINLVSYSVDSADWRERVAGLIPCAIYRD